MKGDPALAPTRPLGEGRGDQDRSQTAQRRPQTLPRGTKKAPRGSKTAPRPPQEAPRETQDRPKSFRVIASRYLIIFELISFLSSLETFYHSFNSAQQPIVFYENMFVWKFPRRHQEYPTGFEDQHIMASELLSLHAPEPLSLRVPATKRKQVMFNLLFNVCLIRSPG